MKDTHKMFPQMNAEVSVFPVLQGEMDTKIDEASLPDSLPLLALRNAVLFPGTIFPIIIGREMSMRLIEDASRNGNWCRSPD